MKKTLTISVLLTTLFSTSLYAEKSELNDYARYNYNKVYPQESREGWTGSLGIGLHTTSFDVNDFSNVDSESSIASSLKFGYNFTQQFGIYYVRNASWFSPEDDLYVNGISGLGLTYYLKPQSKTLYASLAAGIGDFGNIDTSTGETGNAFMATIGYEFSPHWQVEANWMLTNIEDNYNNTL